MSEKEKYFDGRVVLKAIINRLDKVDPDVFIEIIKLVFRIKTSVGCHGMYPEGEYRASSLDYKFEPTDVFIQSVVDLVSD